MTPIRFIVLGAALCVVPVTSAMGQEAETTLQELTRQFNAKTTRLELERMATNSSHFSRTVIIKNRDLNLERYRPFFDRTKEPLPLPSEQRLLAVGLKALSGDRRVLEELLKHSNPRMRTLALGALFLREDGRDLPLIASLIDDTAPTFPNLHDPLGVHRATLPSRMADVETSQTVGDVALAMGRAYLSAAGLDIDDHTIWGQTPTASELERARKIFREYVRQRQGRENCASWWAMKLARATRQTSPTSPEWEPDIKKVLAEMNALEPVERGWTLLYGRGRTFPDKVIPDAMVVEALKAMGPDRLVAFLQHDYAGGPGDPDLRFDDTEGGDKDPNNRLFYPMAVFILKQARELLRPADAEAVLACSSQAGLRRQGIQHVWVDAAVALKSQEGEGKLKAFIKKIKERYPPPKESEGRSQALLLGAMWKERGSADSKMLVEWFYRNLELTVPNGGHEGPYDLLREVQRARREDTHKLLKALVADPRFERTERAVLSQMLEIAGGEWVDWSAAKQAQETARGMRPQPLVSRKEIEALNTSSHRPIESATKFTPLPQTQVLPAWRNLLRKHYGLKERPIPEAPVARAVLKEPSVTYPYADPPMTGGNRQNDMPVQMRFSPDGKWLAILQRRQAEIREAASGKVVGLLNTYLPSSVTMGFFDEPHQLSTLDRSNGIWTWDLTSMQDIKSRRVKPFNEKDPLYGAYAFDAAGIRLARVTSKDVGCYDARSRQIFWQKENLGRGITRTSVALSLDGRVMAASLGAGRSVHLLEPEKGRELRQLEGFAGGIQSLAFSPDGKVLVTATVESGLRFWRVSNGKLLREIAYPVAPGGNEMLFSADGMWLAVMALPENMAPATRVRVGVFKVETGELGWELTENVEVSSWGEIGLAMAFTPDGKGLMTAAGKRLARWELER